MAIYPNAKNLHTCGTCNSTLTVYPSEMWIMPTNRIGNVKYISTVVYEQNENDWSTIIHMEDSHNNNEWKQPDTRKHIYTIPLIQNIKIGKTNLCLLLWEG